MKKLSKFWANWYFRLFLIALVLRLAIMPFAAHPDVWSLSFARYLFVEEKITDVYDFLFKLPAGHPLKNYGENFFTYPPLAYFTFGFFGWLLRPFYQPEASLALMSHYPNIYGEVNAVFKYLFLAKLPYLLFDFGIAFLLKSFFVSEKEKHLAFALWLFNPLGLYAAYLVGQFELLPTFFMVLSLFFAGKKRLGWAALALGFGAAYKMYPLFFLPILVFANGEKWFKKAGLFFLGLLPYLLSILPFVSSPVFRATVLFSKQSEKFLHMSLPVSGAEGIYVFVFLWGIIFWLACYQSFRRPLWFWYLAVLLAFFSLTHYHPQWFVWLTPLLIIQLVATRGRFWFLVSTLFLSWLAITLLFEPSLSFGFFIPLNPSLANLVPLEKTMARFYDPFQFKSVVRSLFAAGSLILILKTFPSRHHEA